MATSDVTNAVLAGDVTVRPDYFDHQFLRADDFKAALEYQQDRRWRHTRDFHLKGVVGATGMTVTYNAEETTITVTEGWAVDDLGRELILPGSTTVAVEGAGDVWASWNETTAHTSSDPGVAGTPDRISEVPQITIGDKPDHAVQLGTLKAEEGGGFVFDASTRQQVGEYIGTTDLQDGAVTAPKIAAGAVIDGKLSGDPADPGNDAQRPVDTANVKSNAITSRTIAANAVIAGKIAAGAVLDGTLDLDPASPGNDNRRPVGNASVKTNAIDSRTLAANAVTDGKIQGDATNPGNDLLRPVGNASVKTNAINSRTLAANAVTDGKIQGDANSPGNDANRPVGSPQLKTGAVTAGKIAANAVTDGTIVGDATDPGGDETKRPVGTPQLKTSAVTSRTIAPLAVTQAKLAAGSVSQNELKTSVAVSGSLSLAANGSTYLMLGNVAAGGANPFYLPSVLSISPVSNGVQIDLRVWQFGAFIYTYLYFTNFSATPLTVGYSVLAVALT